MPRKENYKIVISGPVGSGKTTAIRTLSDIEPVKTDAVATDEVKNIKDDTTVAMDYGVINLGNETRIHLYGTPGQDRFDFMWDILTEGALGIVLLIDNSTDNPLGQLKHFLDAFSAHMETIPLCVGITHKDEKIIPVVNEYKEILESRQLNVPILSVDCRKQHDMNVLLMAMLGTIDSSFLLEEFSHRQAQTTATDARMTHDH